MVLEYVSDWLVVQTVDEIIRGVLGLLTSYALFKTQSDDYIRESQQRMLVQPLLSRLMAHFGDSRRLEQALLQLVQRLQAQPAERHGYAGGNLVNLLVSLRGDVRGLDVSRLVLRQAHLQGVLAQDASIAYADVADTRFTEPLETIISMTASPNGAYLPVGSFSGQLRLWQIADGKPVWASRGHSRTAWALAFSPDSTTLASGGYRGTVRIWDVTSGRPLQVFHGHRAWVRSVAFSPTEPLLASVGGDGTVRLWDPADGRCLHAMQHSASPVGALCFTDDEDALLSASEGLVSWWDVTTGRCFQTAPADSGRNWFKAIGFSPDAGLLASAGEARTVMLWQVEPQGGLDAGRHFDGHASQVWAVALSPDAGTLASSDDTGTVILWDVKTGAELRRVTPDRPYERMQIQGVTGLNATQRAALRALGAVEQAEPGDR